MQNIIIIDDESDDDIAENTRISTAQPVIQEGAHTTSHLPVRQPIVITIDDDMAENTRIATAKTVIRKGAHTKGHLPVHQPQIIITIDEEPVKFTRKLTRRLTRKEKLEALVIADKFGLQAAANLKGVDVNDVSRWRRSHLRLVQRFQQLAL
jgi:hypothetical protein